jgi:GxxExxY protein
MDDDLELQTLNKITEQVIAAAIEVHKELGPGLLESAYEACLLHELTQRGLQVRRQVDLPVRYHGVFVDCGYRIDLLIEEKLIVELKAVEMLERIHTAQVLSYLRMSGLRLGLLINFDTRQLVSGVKRVISSRA